MLKKILKVAAIALSFIALSCVPNHAQTTAFYSDRAVGQFPVNHMQVLIPIAYGQVRVCTLPTSGSPCATPANGFVFDLSGNPATVSGGNFGQFTTDVVGRFSFGCTPGSYQVQVAAGASNTPSLSYPITCPIPGSVPPVNVAFNNVTAAGLTVTGPSTLATTAAAQLNDTGLTAAPYVHISQLSSIVGSGPHQGSPNTPQGWYNTMTGGTGKGVEAGTFAISIPSTYNGTAGLGFVTNALGAYVWSQDPNHFAVGLSNQTVVDATNGFGWGINPQCIAYGANGATGQTCHIIEADAVVTSTGTTIFGVQVGAPSSSTQNPTSAIAFDVSKPSWPNGNWSSGLSIETGAVGGNPAIKLAPQTSAVSQSSQLIQFIGTNGAGVSVPATVSADANGDLAIVPTSGAHIRNTTSDSGIQLLHGGNFTTINAPNATSARAVQFPDAGGTLVIDTAVQALSNKTTIGITGQFTSTLATGTAPLVIASTTPVANLTVQNCGATCAITQPTISTGVSQGSGLKHQRFGVSCTTAAVVNAACNTTYTWTSAFADGNYTVSCSPMGAASGVPLIQQITSPIGASFVLTIIANSAVAAQLSGVQCIAMHD